MKKIMNFFKSPFGKFLLVALVLTVLFFIVKAQYEKKIYGGLTRSKYVDSVAQKLFESKYNAIKQETGYTPEKENEILNGYYIGYTSGSIDNATSINRVSNEVDNSNIDFTKIKDLQTLKDDVLKAYFNKFKR